MKRTLCITGFAIALLVMAAVPTAQANVTPTTLSLQLAAREDPIPPLGGIAVIAGSVEYAYLGAGSVSSITPTVVKLGVTGPAWAVATVTPQTLYMALDPQDGTATAAFSILVVTTADAPALQSGNLQVTATADPNGNLAGSTATEQTPVQAAFVGLLDARVQQPIRKVGPQVVLEFPVEVTNFGNGQTKVTIDVLNVTGGLTVPVPPQLTLEARATSGKAGTGLALVSVQTPHKTGFINEPGMVILGIKSTYAHDPSLKGDAFQTSIMVNTFGFYAPGPAPLGGLVVVGLAALALGRRRLSP